MVGNLENIADVEVDYGVVGKSALTSHAGVKHVQSVARIPAIIAIRGSMEGVVIKGLGTDFDWGTLERFMIQGKLLDVENKGSQSDIIISEYTANRLELKAEDQVILYFLKNDRQTQRRFTVRGIYRTGLEDYDQKFAMAPLPVVQELLGWTDQQVGAYEVFIEDVADVDLINDYIYLEELPAGCYFGIGAAFAFHAGEVDQAPEFFQRHGLEWLYRLFKEPKRLWKRYFFYNSLFIHNSLLSWCIAVVGVATADN